MAKKSKVVREIHLRKMVEKYSSRRKELKAHLKDPKLSLEEKQKVRDELHKGYLRKFGLSRIVVREMALRGEIPGVTKASW